MTSLFSIPPRPTSNNHVSTMLNAMCENIKADVKETILAPCEGKRCSPSQLTKNVCSRCKVASYCSVECQRSDWRTHRLTCQPRAVGTKRFVSTLVHNQILANVLKALFIVRFQLAEKTQFGRSSEPLCIGATLAMLPYGWASRGDVYRSTPMTPIPIAISPSGIDSSGRRKKAGVELFLQITGMSYLSERYPGSYDSRHKIAWDQMDSPGPGRHTRGLQFIGLLFVSDGYRRDRETIVSLLIYKEDIEAFKSGTYFTSYCPIEAVLGERVPRPLTPGDLVMYFNRHVEADIENYFRLRTYLKPDKATLLTWGIFALRTVSTREDLSEEEVIECLRVYNPDGSRLDLRPT